MQRAALFLSVTAALLLAPAVAGEAIRIEGDDRPTASVPAADGPAWVTFEAAFAMEEAGDAYLKVLATPWNPAYRNGTAEVSGWWTDARVDVAGGTVEFVSTNGSASVEFGRLDADTVYNLTLMVHVPAEALHAPMEYRLSYAVAVRPSGNGSGSGGTLNPSASVLPVIQVVEPDPTGASGSSRAPAAGTWAALVACAAAVTAIGICRR